MPTADVLATVKWDTFRRQYYYKLSLSELFHKGYYGMLPHALTEQLIIQGNRSVSRTKHRLIAPRFASNYVANSIAQRGCPLEHHRSFKLFYFGLLRHNLFSEKGRYKCFTFSDFDFNVLPRQTINNRSENFLYFLCLFYDWTILFPSINNFQHFILFVIFAHDPTSL